MTKENIKLSIVILNFNTKDFLAGCLGSLQKLRGELPFEVIVSDNGSIDGSVDMIKRYFKWVKLVQNSGNLGFAKGNNRARKICLGKYVLFLNSDTVVYKNTLKKSVVYMEKHPKVGALSCKLKLPSGSLDKDTRRAFVTPWIAFTHLILRVDRLLPKSRVFSKYWYGYLPEDKIHEVDVIQGAFFLSPKKVLDDVNWFDEDYFLDGEDIDLCWKIKERGYNIVYYPKVSILHLKGATKGNNEKTKSKVPLSLKLKFKLAGVTSMEIFYKKHLWEEYPFILNIMVIAGIKLVKVLRMIKVVTFG